MMINKREIIALGLTAVMSMTLVSCMKGKTDYTPPTEAIESEISVESIRGIGEDFIRGVDVSELLSLEKSGVKFYSFAGTEQDCLKTLADSGVNYVRIRIWNDPYDEEGNGYGGGNCDLDTAITLGKRATEYGMKVLIDFHYSDFWADPARQLCPKAWRGLKIKDKANALYEFTYESLEALNKNGVDVGMVQIGNEINNGLAGEKNNANIIELLKAGSFAVRDFNKKEKKEVKIAVHYTDAGDYDRMEGVVSNLEANELDYDVFAISYYPYWHGDFEKVKSVLKNVKTNHGKDVMVAETSYPYTTKDGDGYGNSMDDPFPAEGYSASLQGQANEIRDVCAMVKEAEGLGVFYWGGIWIPVGPDGDANAEIWKTYGSGWATSYASDYDPQNVGRNYGGCSWDNQALFDFEGHPLETLNVYKYLTYGTICEDKIDYVPDCEVKVKAGEKLILPSFIPAVHADRSKNSNVKVAWDENDILTVDTSKEGKYRIKGTAEFGYEVICTVTVAHDNLLANPSFENEDRSMWSVTVENNGDDPTDYQEKTADAHSGDFAFHYWSKDAMNFTIEQKVTGLEPGTYQASVFSQGGDFDDTASLEFYVIADGDMVYSENFMNDGWANWKDPVIRDIEITTDTLTIGVRVKGNPGSWGTLDDFSLSKTD
ncbi:arabinogalactan endo-1,4-beta-galactosidase [Lachnospiraceae bacterium G11]|nr:arabinogalactan endo-1,4-beta-galactosidase [Lachnospiraceae bacterium G11]